MLAHQFLGILIPLGNAADDGAVVSHAVVKGKLEQFVGLLDLLACLDSCHADIQLGKVVDGHVGPKRLGLEVGDDVLLFDAFQTLDLTVDDVVLDFLKQQHGLFQLLTCRQDVDVAQTAPVGAFHADHAAQLAGAEGQERLEGDGQVGSDLQGHIHDGLHACHIGLSQFPGFAVGQVLVADACQVHGIL